MEGNKRDVFEVFIRDELEREAEEIRRENEAEGKKMPEALKAEIRSNLLKLPTPYGVLNLEKSIL